MSSLWQISRVLGMPNLLSARRARRDAWEDTLSVHFTTRCFQTLLNVGLLDEMAARGTVAVREFAAKHDLDEDLTVALCEDLFARSVLKKEGTDQYSLDDRGKFLFGNDLSRGWFYLCYGYENVLYNLEPLLRKQLRYGVDLQRDGKYVALGSGLASKAFSFPLVIGKLRSTGVRAVLDIGCGDGAFLRDACRQIPGLRAVGLDLSPEAVEFGTAQIRQENLSDRVTLYCGDARRLIDFRDKLGGVEAGATFFVLHELCDGNGNSSAIEFLKAFRTALPGVPFHIVETIRPTAEEMRARPGPAIEYFLFHDLSGQRPVSREAWKTIFERAGYTSVEEDRIDFARMSIFSIK
jgi:SAM-dependent methyltransferase